MIYEAFCSKEASDESDTIYFLLASQVFNAAEASAKVPVTIEADPKVVNLYFVILNRDKKGVVVPELRKIRNTNYDPIKKPKHEPLKQPTPQPKKPRKRPSFPYHALANRRPKSHPQGHKEVKHVTKRPKRVGRMCKRRGKKAIPCSQIKVPRTKLRKKPKGRGNRHRPYYLGRTYARTFDDFHVDIPDINGDINYVLPPPLLVQDPYVDSSSDQPQWVQTNIKEGVMYTPVKKSPEKRCKWPYKLYKESCVIEQKRPKLAPIRQGRTIPTSIKAIDPNRQNKPTNYKLRSAIPKKLKVKNHKKKEDAPVIYLRSRFGIKCDKWMPYAWRISKLCNPDKKDKKSKKRTKHKGRRPVTPHKRKPYNRRISYQSRVSNSFTPRVSVEQTISEVIDVHQLDEARQIANTIKVHVEKELEEDQEAEESVNESFKPSHYLEEKKQESVDDEFKPSQYLGETIESDKDILEANYGSFGQKITTISPQTRTDTYFTPRRLSLHTLCVGECAKSSTR